MATHPAFESQFNATHPGVAPAAMPESDPDTDRLALAEQLLDIAERAQTFTGAGGAIIAVRRGDHLIVRTSSGAAPEVGARFTLDDSIVGLCVAKQRPQDCGSDSAEVMKHPLLAALGLRSAAAVPVRCGSTMQAALAVFSPMPGAFSRTHLAILMTLRDVIGAKLQNAQWPLDAPPADKFVPAPVPAKSAVADKPAPAPVIPPASLQPELKAGVDSPAPPLAVKGAEPRVEMLPKPAASPVAPPPAPTSSVAELLKLVETPPAPPVRPAPGLLAPGEDPRKFEPEAVIAVPAQPVSVLPAVTMASQPVAPAAVRTFVTDTPISVVSAYSEAAENRRGLSLKILAALAALVILTGALALYWSNRPTAAAAAQPAAPGLHAVPLPEPAAAPAAPAAVTVTAEVARPTQPQPAPKPVAATKHEAAAPKPVEERVAPAPIALAPGAPKAASEPAPEAPKLALAGGGAALPMLPSPKTPAASLAVRHAVVVPATLVISKSPVYPEVARRMGIQGAVKLQVTIAADGSVKSVQVVSGESMLREPSISAVRQWHYRPATLDGNPVESSADVVLTFKNQR